MNIIIDIDEDELRISGIHLKNFIMICMNHIKNI